MVRWIAVVSMVGWSTTAMAQDCDSYGEVTPEEMDGYTGSEIIFRISQGNNPECGDVSTCTWSLAPDDPEVYGTLEETVGSPVTWTGPDILEDCSGVAFQVIAQCADQGTVGTATVTLFCQDDDKEAIQEQSRNTTVEGGGCGSAEAAGVFLPFLWLGWRRKRT